jgi:hypothetical protein
MSLARGASRAWWDGTVVLGRQGRSRPEEHFQRGFSIGDCFAMFISFAP